MGEIKSSWEIAREKADELGELSEEERRKQVEDRCRPVGKSLADKYLAGYDIINLDKELNKYNSEEKELIKKMALNYLIDYIDIQNSFARDKALPGILSLAKKDEKVAKILDKMKGLFCEYEEAEKVKKQMIEAEGRELIHQQRISGTAIGIINIRAREEWQRELDAIARPFKEKLDGLKQQLSGLKDCY